MASRSESGTYQPRVGSSIGARASESRGQSSRARLTGAHLVQGTFSVSQGVFGSGTENMRFSRLDDCTVVIAASGARGKNLLSVSAARDVKGATCCQGGAATLLACIVYVKLR